MMQTFKMTVAAATIGLLTVLPATAATITIEASSVQGVTNTAGIGFAVGYGANTPTGATWSEDPTWTPPSGNVGGRSQSPFNSNALTETQAYFTVGGVSGSNGAPSPVTLTFNAVQESFRILWGSIDSYNTIQFYLGVDLAASFTGSDIVGAGPLAGIAPNFEKVALVYFSDFFTDDPEGGQGFDSVKFISTSAAFEFGLEPAPVPLPAAGFLLIGALGGLAALRRRKTAA